jgi:hydroxymethylpyrimidine/phosphomethylpyrimidine kinase
LAEAVDLLVTPEGTQRFAAGWVKTDKLHGTGCILSAAIAAWLARGAALAEAVMRAKAHLTATLAHR